MKKLNIKINWEQVEEVAKRLGSVAVVGTALYVLNRANEYIERQGRSTATYSDAVRAILRSNMYPSAKEECMKFLLKQSSGEYYSSIIDIVNSSTYPSSKVNMLKTLSDEK